MRVNASAFPALRAVTPEYLPSMAMASGAFEAWLRVGRWVGSGSAMLAPAGGPRVRFDRSARRARCARAPCSDAKSSLLFANSSLFLESSLPFLRTGAAVGRPPQAASALRRAPAAPARRRVCHPSATDTKSVGEGGLLCYICSPLERLPMTFLCLLSRAARALRVETHPRSDSPCNLL